MLCDLPPELHQCIADQLPSDKDLNALARTNKVLYRSLNAHLYLVDVLRGHNAALLWAASHGHVSTARKALAAGADIKSRIGMNGTTIHIAASGGHVDVLKLLLAVEGADPNATDELSGYTPLCHAALRGLDHVIEYLIYSGGADPNCTTRYYEQTPLWLAKEPRTVKTLLATGRVNINQQDVSTNSPLLHACNTGNLEKVKLLIAEEACDVNLQNNDGFAPLTKAVYECYPEIVRLLVAVDGINVNISNGSDYSSPLIIAITKGYADIVRILLETGNVDLGHSGGPLNRTPLLFAAEFDHTDAALLLLALPGVDIDAKDTNDRTPLLWSAMHGNYAIFRMLRCAGPVDLNAKDTTGKSVLIYAVQSGCYEMVEDIVTSGQVSLTENPQHAVFWKAATSKHWEASTQVRVLQLLLNREEVYNVYKGDKGWNLIAETIQRDMGHVVSFLLHSLPLDRKMADRKGCNFLHIAAYSDAYESAKAILCRRACDINARDRKGRTALLCASESNSEEVPKLLLQQEELDLHVVHPRSGQNALFHAFERQNRATWVCILESGRMDCNSKDRNGRTMLSLSASNGWVWNIERLLHMGADPRVKDDDGRTPLKRAKEKGHENIAEELEKAKFMMSASEM